MQLIRTNSDNFEFIALVKELDAYLKIKDGDEHSFYSQFNKIDSIKYVLLAYENNTAIACGAIKEYSSDRMEIKRMFVSVNYRGKGVASLILKELEIWAKELKFFKCILETGSRQTEAIALYRKNNYKIIPSYGQYLNVENSICFEKIIEEK